jgi:GAF domain-containing protein
LLEILLDVPVLFRYLLSMKIAAASLSDDALFEEVAEIIHEVSGAKRARITRDARLSEDLRIHGDDGHDLFEALHDRFEMDWTGLDLELHVGKEGHSWPWRLHEGAGGYEPEPLSVGMLNDALRAGRWPEYQLLPRARGAAIRQKAVAWGAFLFLAGMFAFGLAATLSRTGS